MPGLDLERPECSGRPGFGELQQADILHGHEDIVEFISRTKEAGPDHPKNHDTGSAAARNTCSTTQAESSTRRGSSTAL